jgi:ribonuclease III
VEVAFPRLALNPFLRFFRLGPISGRKKLRRSITHILGERPTNLGLYQLALRHSSASRETGIAGFRESNERLEYLGDAVLGMVIAEYLFKRYPYKDEGFLTDIRSRFVNREMLNSVSRKIGLDLLIEYDGQRTRSLPARTSMYGDALEALVGAIFLDKGFKVARRFILKQLLAHYDIESVVQNNANFKSRLIEWAQRTGKDVRFDIIQETGAAQFREFVAQVSVDDVPLTTGSGFSKKKAEQAAAEKALDLLEAV